jgi:hypothetical protein
VSDDQEHGVVGISSQPLLWGYQRKSDKALAKHVAVSDWADDLSDIQCTMNSTAGPGSP